MLSTDMTSLLSRAAKVCYHNQKQRGFISIPLTTEQIFLVFFCSPKDDVFKLKDLKLFNPPWIHFCESECLPPPRGIVVSMKRSVERYHCRLLFCVPQLTQWRAMGALSYTQPNSQQGVLKALVGLSYLWFCYFSLSCAVKRDATRADEQKARIYNAYGMSKTGKTNRRQMKCRWRCTFTSHFSISQQGKYRYN